MIVRSQIFVWKTTVTVNRSLSSSIMIDEVSSLYHEVFNYTVECGILITSGVAVSNVFSGAKLSKVFTCLGTLRAGKRQERMLGENNRKSGFLQTALEHDKRDEPHSQIILI
jgi:hypothetical protein